MKLKEIPKYLFSKHPFYTAIATIGLSTLVAAILFALSGGLLIPTIIIIGSIFTVGTISALIRYTQPPVETIKEQQPSHKDSTPNQPTVKQEEPAKLETAKLNNKEELANDFMKVVLMRASGNGNLGHVREILNNSGFSLERKMALLSHADSNNGSTPLMPAANEGHLEIVREILNNSGLSLEHKITLLHHKDHQGRTALMRANNNHHLEVVREILNNCGFSLAQKMDLLKDEDGNGDTLLTRAAQDHLEKVQEILNRSGLSVEHKIALLHHKNKDNGLTALMWASRQFRPEIVSEILNNCGFSLAKKMDLLTVQDDSGFTVLMQAAIYCNPEVVREVLNSVPPEQRPSLLTYRNPINDEVLNVIEHAFENGHHDIVTLLQQYGAVLPDRARLGNRNFNDGQSTHTATVHDSLSRSAMACVARLECIPATDKTILSTWVQSRPAEAADRDRHRAALSVMQKISTQDSLNKLVDQYYPDILKWAKSLDKTDDKKASVARALQRIENSTAFREARSHLTLKQTLVLTWMALIFEKADKNKPFKGQELLDRQNNLIQYIWEIQRQYNINDRGKDTNRNREDSPSCLNGTFHNLIMPLSGGFDPDVSLIFVNDKTVAFKARQLVTQFFVPTEPEYTPEVIKALNTAFFENFDYKMPNEIRALLKKKVLEKLNSEFSEFVKDKFLKQDDIENAAETATTLLSPQTIEVIEQRLKTLKDQSLITPEKDSNSQAVTIPAQMARRPSKS